MRFYPLRPLFFIASLILIFSAPAQAQMSTRAYRCLQAAFNLQTEKFKADGKYVTDDKEIVKLLPEACNKIEYSIGVYGEKGFRVTLEVQKESWSINEVGDVVHNKKSGISRPPTVAAALPPKAPADPAPPPAPEIPRLSVPEKSDAPPASIAAPVVTAPAPAAPPASSGLPSVGPRTAPMAVLAKPPAAARAPAKEKESIFSVLSKLPKFERPVSPSEQLNGCFDKKTFQSSECVKLFADIDIRCRGKVEPPSEVCVEFDNAMKSVNFETTCVDDAQYGKCELRRAQLQAACANPLKAMSAECQAFRVFNAAFAPGAQAKAVNRVPMQVDRIKPVQSCAKGDRQMCVGEYCKIASMAGASREDLIRCAQAQGLNSNQSSLRNLKDAKALDSALNLVARLRPVTYIWNETNLRDIGFVAEDVSLVDPRLITYSEDGQIQGVKYGQISALLAGGMQELYGYCQATSDQQAELTRRLQSLEKVNTQLINQNKMLSLRLDQQAQELEALKIKMGFK